MISQPELILLNSIKESEGGVLHRNSTENDITTGYGIYRTSNPSASIFSYIDSVAKGIGITTPSSKWSKEEISKVNSAMNPDKELEYTSEFYRGYFKYDDYKDVPDKLRFSFFNVYVTSKTIASKALQSTFNLFIKKFPEIGLKPLYGELNPIKVDGVLGSGSKAAINKLGVILEKENNLYIESLVLIFFNYVKTFYIDISTDNIPKDGTDKQAIYLRGWDARVNKIMEEML